ncbi:MAG: hypothetical protein FWG47_00900 [Propionibacteriaceae bacterium]|nr:hypothetical protein [Propionibacteriaceae bacterium]
MEGLNSNLNLNEGSPPRVIPGIGEWSPVNVLSTKKKKRQRWITLAVFVVALAALTAYGYWMYTLLR